MANNEKIVEMFRNEMEQIGEQIKEKQKFLGEFPQTHPSIFSELHELSIIHKFLQSKFSSIEIIEKLKNQGLY